MSKNEQQQFSTQHHTSGSSSSQLVKQEDTHVLDGSISLRNDGKLQIQQLPLEIQQAIFGYLPVVYQILYKSLELHDYYLGDYKFSPSIQIQETYFPRCHKPGVYRENYVLSQYVQYLLSGDDHMIQSLCGDQLPLIGTLSLYRCMLDQFSTSFTQLDLNQSWFVLDDVCSEHQIRVLNFMSFMLQFIMGRRYFAPSEVRELRQSWYMFLQIEKRYNKSLAFSASDQQYDCVSAMDVFDLSDDDTECPTIIIYADLQSSIEEIFFDSLDTLDFAIMVDQHHIDWQVIKYEPPSRWRICFVGLYDLRNFMVSDIFANFFSLTFEQDGSYLLVYYIDLREMIQLLWYFRRELCNRNTIQPVFEAIIERCLRVQRVRICGDIRQTIGELLADPYIGMCIRAMVFVKTIKRVLLYDMYLFTGLCVLCVFSMLVVPSMAVEGLITLTCIVVFFGQYCIYRRFLDTIGFNHFRVHPFGSRGSAGQVPRAFIVAERMGLYRLLSLEHYHQSVSIISHGINKSLILNSLSYVGTKLWCLMYGCYSSPGFFNHTTGESLIFVHDLLHYHEIQCRSADLALQRDSRPWCFVVDPQSSLEPTASVQVKLKKIDNHKRNLISIQRIQKQKNHDLRPKSSKKQQRKPSKFDESVAYPQGLFDIFDQGSEFFQAVKHIGKLASGLEETRQGVDDALRYVHTLSGQSLEFILKYKSEIASLLLSGIILYGLGSGKYKDPVWQKIIILCLAITIFLNQTRIYSSFIQAFPDITSLSDFKGICSEQQAAQLISTIIIALSGKCIPKDYSIQGLCQASFGFSRAFSDMKSFVEYFVTVSRYCLEFLFENVMGIDAPRIFFTEEPKLQKWIDQVSSTLKESLRGELIFNANNAERCYQLEYEGIRLMKILCSSQHTRGLVESMKKPLSQISNLVQEMVKKGVFKKGVRMEPLAIMLRGPSAIGKSRLTLPLLYEVIARVIDERDKERFVSDPDSFVYFRMPEQDFWDGYDPGKFATVIDDFGQEGNNMVGSVSCGLEMIRIINNFETPLHMADLAEKSNTRFTSKIVLATTNLQVWPTHGIVEPEALKRRFDFDVTVDLKPQFRETVPVGSNDKSNVWGYRMKKEESDVSQLNLDMYVFKVPGHGDLDWSDFIDLCVRRFQLKQDRYCSMLSDLPEAINRGLSKRDIVPQGPSNPSEFFLDEDDDDMRAFEILNEKCDANRGINTKLREMLAAIDDMREQFCKYLRGMLLYVKKVIIDGGFDMMWQIYQLLNWVDFIIIAMIVTWIIRFAYSYFTAKPPSDLEFEPQPGYDKYRDYSDDSDYEEIPVAVSQSGLVDTNLVNIRQKIWSKSTFAILNPSGSIGGFGIFLKENYFMLPSHYLSGWRDLYFAKRRKYGSAFELEIGIRLKNVVTNELIVFDAVPCLSEAIIDTSFDVAIIQIPNLAQMKPDITKLFVTRETFGNRRAFQGQLVLFRSGQQRPIDVHVQVSRQPVIVRHKDGDRPLADALQYDIVTQHGDCGCPLLLVDPSSRSEKIVGFHIAGNGVSGFSCFLNFEYIDFLLNSFSTAEVQFSVEKTQKFSYKSSVPRPPGRAVSTTLRKSPLFEKWGPHLKEPAQLKPFIDSDGNRIDPFTIALSKYDVIMEPLPPSRVKLAVSLAMQFIFDGARITDVDRSALTYDQAVCGIDGEPYVDGIDRSTSLGYPLCMQNYGSGKKYFLGEDGPIDTTSQSYKELRYMYEQWEQQLVLGGKPQAIFMACLKDELRDISKVQTGQTRMFFSSPVFLLIAFKKYFGRICAFMMKDRIRNSMTPGINVYGQEWHMLARFFGFESGNLVDGDIKGFDNKQRSAFHMFIGELWMMYFKSDDEHVNRMRRLLWQYVLKPDILVNRDIYEVTDMLVSGMAVTLLLNCMYCASLLTYCALDILEWDRDAPQVLLENFRFQVNGDDNIWNSGDKIADKIHFFSMRDAMLRIGIEYTPGDKGSQPVKFKKLTEITYLKRRFRFESKFGKYVAPLSMSSILEMPYWSRRGSQYLDICRTNVERAILELSLHGEQVFQEWAPRIIAASSRYIHYIPLRTDWHECIEFTFTDGAWKMLKQEYTLDSDFQFQSSLESTCVISFGEQCRQNSRKIKTQNRQRLHSNRWSYLGNRIGHLGQYPKTLCTWSQEQIDECIASSLFSLATNQIENQTMSSVGMADVKENGTTSFDNTSVVNSNTAGQIPDIPRSLLKSTSVDYAQDIREFLKKPYIVSTGSWGVAAGQNATLTSVSIPDAVFSASPIFKNKVSGFLGFRATAVATLQVNANKFQQGRLLMCFIPQAQYSTYANVRIAALNLATQLPNVQLDAACDTECVLRVPYTSPTNYYDLTTQDGKHGIVYVQVYSPLQYGTGTSSAEYTLWIHFEDVELVGPTIPQSSRETTVSFVKKKRRGLPSEKEVSSGQLSSVLKQMQTGFDVFSKIPTLQPFMSSASWVAGALGGAAASFGWSKPTITSAPHRIARNAFTYGCNGDGADSSQCVGFSAENKISQMNVAGHSMDEMSFKFIAQIPAFYGQVTWNTSTAVGAQLFTTGTGPYSFCNFNTTSITGTPKYYWFYAPPFAAIAHLFWYYRTSLKLIFKIVKTSFHTGRLMLTYVPGYSPVSTPTYSTANSQYALREIIDISEGHEFSFVIPYVSVKPWQRTGDPADGTTYFGPGFVYLEVLNTLQCPDTVSQSINILLEVAACDDFEVAVPRPLTQTKPFVGVATPQSSIEDTCEIVAKVVGSASYSNDGPAPSEFCIGEQINSARLLCKKMVPVFTQSNPIANVSEIVRPFSLGVGSSAPLDSTLTNSFCDNDYISYFGTMFAYNRGSVRFKIYTDIPGNVRQGKAYYIMDTQSTNSYRCTSLPSNNFRNFVYSYNETTGGSTTTAYLEVLVPHYNQLHSRLNQYSSFHFDEPTNLYASDVFLVTDWPGFTTGTTVTDWYRAAGDDFTFHFFLSTMPVMYQFV